MPVMPRDLRLEVPGRMDADGQVVTPLDEAAVLAAGRALLAQIWPDDHITLDHAILSESREFERGAGSRPIPWCRTRSRSIMACPSMCRWSIARVNAAGLPEVGPHSAGAGLGPVCYGRGGMAPTMSDANLLLGRQDPRRLAVRGGGGDPAGQNQDGRGDAHGIAVAGCRSTGFRAVCLRRCGAAACRRSGPRAGRAAGACPVASGAAQRMFDHRHFQGPDGGDHGTGASGAPSPPCAARGFGRGRGAAWRLRAGIRGGTAARHGPVS